MIDEFNTEDVVDKIFQMLDGEGLLREADPFMLRYLKIGACDRINHELYNLPDSYEVGYDAGYQEGKDRGYEEGASDTKDKVWDFAENHEELYAKITAFLEDMEL